MADSFKSDEDWENDLKEFFELLESGTPASYVERMVELKARKGNVYASAVEAAVMERHKKDAKKEEVQNTGDLVERIAQRVYELSKEESEEKEKAAREREEDVELFHSMYTFFYQSCDLFSRGIIKEMPNAIEFNEDVRKRKEELANRKGKEYAESVCDEGFVRSESEKEEQEKEELRIAEEKRPSLLEAYIRLNRVSKDAEMEFTKYKSSEEFSPSAARTLPALAGG